MLDNDNDIEIYFLQDINSILCDIVIYVGARQRVDLSGFFYSNAECGVPQTTTRKCLLIRTFAAYLGLDVYLGQYNSKSLHVPL